MEKVPGRIDLYRQPAFRKIDLHRMGTQLKAIAYLSRVFSQKIINKLLASVSGNLFCRVHQTQSGRRNDGLLKRNICVTLGLSEIAVSPVQIIERAFGQTKHAADMPCRKRYLEAIWGRVRQPLHGIRPKVMIFALLAVRNDGRSRRLKTLDRIAGRFFVKRLKLRAATLVRRDRCDKFGRTWNTSDRLCGYDHLFCPRSSEDNLCASIVGFVFVCNAQSALGH